MLLYRVANRKYKTQTLSGIGAEKVGGRWNLKGSKAVYCSENVSLALLEYYVNTQNIKTLPKSILLAVIDVPETFVIEKLEELPENWNAYPYTENTSKTFTSKVKNPNFFGLKVPSAVVPMEHNVILNPLHPDFHFVNILEFMTLPLDRRLKIS